MALWESLGADGSIGAEALDLSRNELEALPGALLAPPASRNPFAGLVCLDVSRNRLTELPAALATAAPALIDVRAAANHLRPAARALSPALRAALLPRLRLFDLRFNPKLHRGAPQDDGGGASVPARAGGWLEAELREWMTRPGALLLLTPPERRRGGTRTGGVDGIISGLCDLRAQLSPLSTPTLRRRLEAEFGVHTDPECTGRDGVLEALLDAYERVGGRTQLRMEDAGVPLPPAVVRELLQALRETAWGSLRNEREKVSSTGGYVLLRRGDGSASASNAQRRALAKRRRHARVWDAAHAALRCADASFAEQYDTIALAYGFTGSPHIDSYDVDVQYTASFGEFTNGGELCVERDARTVVVVNTRGRVVCADGRCVHWVRPYLGERWSVVWFRTRGEVAPRGQAVPGVREGAVADDRACL